MKSFSARIPEDLYEEITKACAAEGISQAAFIIEAATTYLGMDAGTVSRDEFDLLCRRVESLESR